MMNFSENFKYMLIFQIMKFASSRSMQNYRCDVFKCSELHDTYIDFFILFHYFCFTLISLHDIYISYTSQHSFRQILVFKFDVIVSRLCDCKRHLKNAFDRVFAQTRVDQNAIFATFVWIAFFHHDIIRTKTRRSMITMKNFVVFEQQSSQIFFWMLNQHDETMHRLFLIAFFRRLVFFFHHDVAKRFDDSIIDAFFLRVCVDESTIQFVVDDDWNFVIFDVRRIFVD